MVVLAAGVVSVAAVPVPPVDLGNAGVQQRGGLALLHREEGEREDMSELLKWSQEQGNEVEEMKDWIRLTRGRGLFLSPLGVYEKR